MSTASPIPSKRPREQGFALLFIFLMAAMVAVGLYAVLPRVAFEAERDREQLLVDRGEQYKRGIQLYFRKLHTYPAKLEALEDTNGIRFLRQRYKDPTNNSDEWRLIHVGPNGVFIDSITQKNKAQAAAASVNNSVTELKPIADGAAAPSSDVNVALRQRPSDNPNGQTAPGGDPNNPNNPINPNNQPPPAFDPGGGVNGGDPQNPGSAPFPPFVNDPSGGGAYNGPAPGSVPTPLPGGVQPGGFGAQQGSNAGADQIRRLLTTPNPRFANQYGGTPPPPPVPAGPAPDPLINSTQNVSSGAPGAGTPAAQLGSTGQTVGGGIAGVASKVERKGIKIYNERHKFNEWEFIYDYGKEAAAATGLPQQPQNPNQNGQSANPGQQNNPNPQNPVNPNNPTNPAGGLPQQ